MSSFKRKVTDEVANPQTSNVNHTTKFYDIPLSDTESDGSYDMGGDIDTSPTKGDNKPKAEESPSEELGTSSNSVGNGSDAKNNPQSSWSFFRNLKFGQRSSMLNPLDENEERTSQWLQDAKMSIRDRDLESVLSNDSCLSSDCSIHDSSIHIDKMDSAEALITSSSNIKPIEGDNSSNQDFEDLAVDISIGHLQSELQVQFEEMSRILFNTPIGRDSQTPENITQQLQRYSRAIAAMFGDDITTLKKQIEDQDSDYSDLSARAKEQRGIIEKLHERVSNCNAMAERLAEEHHRTECALAAALEREQTRMCKDNKTLASMRTTYQSSTAKLRQAHSKTLEITRAKYDSIIDQKEHKIRSLLGNNLVYQSALHRMQEQVEKLTESNQNLKTEIKDRNISIDCLLDEVGNVTKEVSQKQADIKNSTRLQRELKRTMKDRNTDIDDLLDACDSLAYQVHEFSLENEKLKDEFKGLQEEKNQLWEGSKECWFEILQLRNEKVQSSKYHLHIFKEYEKYFYENRKLLTEIACSVNEKQQLKDQKNELLNKNEQFQSMNEDLLGHNRKLSKEKARLLESKKSVLITHQTLLITNNKLRSDMEELLNNHTQLLGENEKLSNEKEESSSLIKKLLSSSDEVSKEIELLTSAVASTAKAASARSQEIIDLTAKADHVSQLQVDLSNAHKKIKDYQIQKVTQLAKFNADLNVARSETQVHRKHKEAANLRVLNLENDVKNAAAELKQLRKVEQAGLNPKVKCNNEFEIKKLHEQITLSEAKIETYRLAGDYAQERISALKDQLRESMDLSASKIKGLITEACEKEAYSTQDRIFDLEGDLWDMTKKVEDLEMARTHLRAMISCLDEENNIVDISIDDLHIQLADCQRRLNEGADALGPLLDKIPEGEGLENGNVDDFLDFVQSAIQAPYDTFATWLDRVSIQREKSDEKRNTIIKRGSACLEKLDNDSAKVANGVEAKKIQNELSMAKSQAGKGRDAQERR